MISIVVVQNFDTEHETEVEVFNCPPSDFARIPTVGEYISDYGAKFYRVLRVLQYYDLHLIKVCLTVEECEEL